MAKGKIVYRTCGMCGVAYYASSRSNYCSGACRQAAYRQTDKGKASVERFNKKVKRPDIQKECCRCGIEFMTSRKNQKLCLTCSSEFSVEWANRKAKRLDMQKECRICGTEFTTASKTQKLCTACSRSDEVMAHLPRAFPLVRGYARAAP